MSSLSPALAAHLPTGMLADGQWTAASGGRTFEVGVHAPGLYGAKKAHVGGSARPEQP